MKNNHPVSGSCLCGAVTLTISSLNRDVVMCHCQQCRKQTSYAVAATRANDTDLSVTGTEHVTWFAASDIAKRGFCKHCGSILFWKRKNTDTTSIMAGCLESPTHLELVSHIFTADKGDFYELNDGVPKYEQSD